MSNYSKINYHQGNVIPDVLPKFTKSKPKTLLEERIETINREINRESKCHCEPSSFALQEPTVNDPPIRWQKVNGKWLWICTNCELERVKSSVIFTESIKVQKENPLDPNNNMVAREYALMREQRISELEAERTETFGYSNCIDRFSQLPNVKNIELCGSSGLVFEYWN